MSLKSALVTTLGITLLCETAAWADKHEDHDKQQGPHGQANGAAHGKKTGWRGCDLPPGQAKKYGCVAPPPPVHPVVVHVAPPPPPPTKVGVQVHLDAVIHP